jgi:hypothetical protein
MASDAVDLDLITQDFNSKKIHMKIKGVMISYNNMQYCVTLHHNLPISKVILQEITLPKFSDTGWNESVILDCNDIKFENIKVHNNFNNKILKSNEIIMMKTSQKRYEMITAGFDFIPFDNCVDSPAIPYIIAKFIDEEKNYAGLSGSPIFIGNKLVGLFSKYDHKNKIAFIIPIYIILKSIDKKDNNTIFGCDIHDIVKINSYNIHNNEKTKKEVIYHPTMKIYIPISSYFMIEGDVDERFTIQYKENSKTLTQNYTCISIKLLMDNTNLIIRDDKKYMITFRLLTFMKKIGIEMCYIQTIMQKIIHNHYENTMMSTWITMNDDEIQIL